MDNNLRRMPLDMDLCSLLFKMSVADDAPMNSSKRDDFAAFLDTERQLLMFNIDAAAWEDRKSRNGAKSLRLEGSVPRLLDGKAIKIECYNIVAAITVFSGKSQIKHVPQNAGAPTRWTLAQPAVAQAALPDL
ncbi:hypothetical protein Tco_0425759 [Tanacetum coccineum]